MIHRILVGVDFRQPSLTAARWAATHLSSAEIELVHVLRRPEVPPFLRGLADPPADRSAMSEESATRALQGLAETLPGRRISVRTLQGQPHEALAELANSSGIDLVVLGRDVLDGSRGRTLERIARGVDVPILVIGTQVSGKPASLIAAVDASPLRAGVLRCADRLTRLFDAELTLLHVLPEGLGRQVHRLTHAWLSGLHRSTGSHGLRLRTSVVEGAAGPCILAEARPSAGLVIVGRTGADSSSAMGLGSATRLVLRAAAGPVLIVPTADAWRPSLKSLDRRTAELIQARSVSVA